MQKKTKVYWQPKYGGISNQELSLEEILETMDRNISDLESFKYRIEAKEEEEEDNELKYIMKTCFLVGVSVGGLLSFIIMSIIL